VKNIEIHNPIVLKDKVLLSINIVEGKKIYENGVEINFECPNCKSNNSFIINNDSGELLDNLFLKKKLITKDEIIKKHVAKESPKIYRYLGELMIFQNLSVLYSFLKCNNCEDNFIVVFSFGESQPSRDVCYISGLWKIEEIGR
jgi:hypothetical protein